MHLSRVVVYVEITIEDKIIFQYNNYIAEYYKSHVQKAQLPQRNNALTTHVLLVRLTDRAVH